MTEDFKKEDATPDVEFGESSKWKAPLAVRLRDFIKSAGLSRQSFADTLGITYSKLASYLEGKAQPGNEFWQALTSRFPEADLVWLVVGQRVVVREQQEIPIIKGMPAGGMRDIPDEEPIGSTLAIEAKGTDLFALRVMGDSMSPELEDGDVVVFDRHAPFVNGKVYASRSESGATTLKRAYRRNGYYELIPANEQHESLRIYGPIELIRAVEMHRVMR